MIRVTAPGLPTFPKLWFDPKQRRAKVSMRHPTWHSYEWAIRATELITWITCGVLTWLIWPLIPPFEDWVVRVIAFLFVAAFVCGIAAAVLRVSLREFLARQLFATRTVLWFTPEAIVIRSRLYARPVVVWRRWNAHPVSVRFILQEDRNAQVYANSFQRRRRSPADHLKEAVMLEVVVLTANRQSKVDFMGQSAVFRSIPISEVSSRWAARFTMVYTAAAALTSPVQTTQSSQPAAGVDIDAA